MIEMTDEQREAFEVKSAVGSQLRSAEAKVKTLSKAIALRMVKAKYSKPAEVSALLATMGAELRAAIADVALLRAVERGAEAVSSDMWAPKHD